MSPVRVRLAPSPTGDPHVGTAYIGLFNYAFARRHGGKFVLRIEDTDRSRSSAASEAAIFRALRWVGLSWDEGPDVGGPHAPYRQSERLAIYRRHGELLLGSGSAYYCFCSPERLEQMREQQRRAKLPPKYDGACRALAGAEAERRVAQGEPWVLRLKVPESGETVVADQLREPIRIQNATIDDQVLLKSDGYPTYHLANVVDDHLMEISHVIRAEEWIASTSKHLLLYRAFGWTAPEFLHLPLLRNADNSKISKRKNPVSLEFYRRQGYLPEALLNFLALMGWSMGEDRELFSLDDMVREFSFDRISLGGPVFDLKKLDWINGKYLRALPAAELRRRLSEWIEPKRERLADRATLEALLPLLQERLVRLGDFHDAASFFFDEPLRFDAALLIPKGKSARETAKVLSGLNDQLRALSDWSVNALEPLHRAHAEASGWDTKELFMTVRIAVTGRRASPPLFETMTVLGGERCLGRLEDAVAYLQAL
ncbi:MAG TPA: glutamate--tRNA ligase [Acidobacteriota bacterium]